MDLILRPMQESDLDSVDELLKAAYQMELSRKDVLRYFLTWPPDEMVAVIAVSAESAAEKEVFSVSLATESVYQGTLERSNFFIPGFGGAINYGSFAYIGLMSVHPSVQKQGIGHALLDGLLAWLDERGCPTVLLDARSAGIHLYQSHGFQVIDQTLVLHQTQTVSLPLVPLTGSVLREDELSEIIAFDAPFFGAERKKLLTTYWTEAPHRVLTTRTNAGDISGYLIARPRMLGPWVARSPAEAEQLLVNALALPFESEPGVFVSAQHTDALHLLNSYGFQQQRTLSHMERGSSLQRGRSTAIYGQASLGFG